MRPQFTVKSTVRLNDNDEALMFCVVRETDGKLFHAATETLVRHMAEKAGQPEFGVRWHEGPPT